MTFKKGDKWNGNRAGRTPGTGHRQQAFNALVVPHKKELFDKAIELALAGNEPMLRLLLERMMPAKPVDEPIGLDISTELTLENSMEIGKQVLTLVAQQKITPREAKSLFSVVKYFQENIAIIELLEMVKKLQNNFDQHQAKATIFSSSSQS